MQSQFHGQFRPINGFPRLPNQLPVMPQNMQQMMTPQHQMPSHPPNIVAETPPNNMEASTSIPPPPHRLWNAPKTRAGFQQVPQQQIFQSNGPNHQQPPFPPPFHQIQPNRPINMQPMNGRNSPNSHQGSRQFQRPIPDIPPPLPTQEQLDRMHHQMHKRPLKQPQGHQLQPHHHNSNSQSNPNHIAPQYESHQVHEASHEAEMNYQQQHQQQHQQQSSDEDRQRALESNQKYEALFKALGEPSKKQRHQQTEENHVEPHALNPQLQEQTDDCPWQRARGGSNANQAQAQPFHNSPSHQIPSQKLPPPPIQERIIPQVPGPCDPEDLVDGVLFSSNYLGSTQLKVDKNSTKTARMMQAQEAMTRVKGELAYLLNLKIIRVQS